MRLVEGLGVGPLLTDLERVESALQASVASQDQFLADVSGHLLRAGGKRLRPTLTLCAAYAACGEHEQVRAHAVTGGASVELVHLGSLYHDDVIDEAETRRGVPSVNARWSNIVAILAGDFLLAKASALAASLGADVAGLLADTIGELCRGQVLELQHLFDATRSEEAYFSAVEGKTASLMATSCRVGGMVSGVDDATLDALTQFGFHLGMCFQIVDDVLDVVGTDAELGKPAGNDLHEGVYTLPVIAAIALEPELRDLLGRKLEWPDVERARQLVARPDVLDASFAVARVHSGKAVEALRGADALDPDVCERLAGLVEGLVTRSS
ncbi:MAG TPA: polyprenyl synthetase family protein [Acidimicrobiia bacterium]|nr:polyprenyl synthetase family protein [Acidimicrobiia bacterium]